MNHTLRILAATVGTMLAMLLASPALPAPASAATCTPTYVLAPDLSSLTILFDTLSLSQTGTIDCDIALDLPLPA